MNKLSGVAIGIAGALGIGLAVYKLRQPSNTANSSIKPKSPTGKKPSSPGGGKGKGKDSKLAEVKDPISTAVKDASKVVSKLADSAASQTGKALDAIEKEIKGKKSK